MKPCIQSPVVNTIFSFVDRQRTKEVTSESTTDTALAELYAQVQAMPESAQKKRLITKLNHANGYGTPKILKPFSSKSHHANVTETLENFKSWITPRNHRKTSSTINTAGSLQKGTKKEKPIGRSGSYSLKKKKHSEMITLEEQAAPHSFRRCISEQQEGSSSNSNQAQYIATPLPDTFHSKQEMVSSSVEPEGVEKGTTCTVDKEEEQVDTVHLPPPSTFSVKSVQKRAPPPIPPRVSSLKPRRETPRSPCCDNSANVHMINGITDTPNVSSTPLPPGLFKFIVKDTRIILSFR